MTTTTVANPFSPLLAFFWNLSMGERVFYALITVVVGVFLIYIVRRIRDAVHRWKHMPADKFFLDTQGEYRDADGFDMDGYGAVQADGYCYDRYGRDKDGIHYETGLDEAGYRRDGFSEYGFHKENGSRYNPLTGLDINGLAKDVGDAVYAS